MKNTNNEKSLIIIPLELIEDLKTKGMIEPDKKIVNNYQKIVNNYNKFSEDLGMEEKLTETELLNNILRK